MKSHPADLPAYLLAVITISLAASAFINAAPAILPPGYELPQEPSPYSITGASSSCQGSTEEVSLDYHGFAVMRVELNTLSPFPHNLLTINLGDTTAFMPSTMNMLLMPGAEDSEPDSIQVRIGDRKIAFDASVLNKDGQKMFRAKNYQDYCLRRENGNVVVRNLTLPTSTLYFARIFSCWRRRNGA